VRFWVRGGGGSPLAQRPTAPRRPQRLGVLVDASASRAPADPALSMSLSDQYAPIAMAIYLRNRISAGDFPHVVSEIWQS